MPCNSATVPAAVRASSLPLNLSRPSGNPLQCEREYGIIFFEGSKEAAQFHCH